MFDVLDMFDMFDEFDVVRSEQFFMSVGCLQSPSNRALSATVYLFIYLFIFLVFFRSVFLCCHFPSFPLFFCLCVCVCVCDVKFVYFLSIFICINALFGG